MPAELVDLAATVSLISELTSGTLGTRTATARPPRVTVDLLSDLPGRPCPIAASLEVVGERWALLVVREVALGSHRFTDIVPGHRRTPRPGRGPARDARRGGRAGAPALLERAAARRVPPDRAGRDLLPVLDALLRWGRRHAVDPTTPTASGSAPHTYEEPR